jgi:hypothetical protein
MRHYVEIEWSALTVVKLVAVPGDDLLVEDARQRDVLLVA